MLRRHVYLLGFMACGKTTVGRELAQHLGCPFYDLDALIEQQQRLSVAEIFAHHGEAAFRRMEAEALRWVAQQAAGVVATGGGTPCFADNMAFMNSHGITVHIHLPAAVLSARLASDRAQRPLISGLTTAQLHHYVEQTLAQRAPFYAQSTHTLNAIDTPPNALAIAIANAICNDASF